MLSCLQRFLASRSGNLAMAAALASMPIVLAMGFAVDFSEASRAKVRLQEIADGAALAIAASGKTDGKEVEDLAGRFISGNLEQEEFHSLDIKTAMPAKNKVAVAVDAKIPTRFMKIAGYEESVLSARAVAERAVIGSVEVSLVLDNTYSMSEADAKGVTKIQALKDASTLLVNELYTHKDADIRMAVVPYADYVNVGTSNRNACWLSVPADSSATSTRTCKQITSEQVCAKRAPSYSCTSTTDGVTTTGTCQGACTEYTTKTYDPPKESCSGGTTTNYTWYGCVWSRKVNAVRLEDGSPSTPYPGPTAASQQCPSAILPLTVSQSDMLAKIGEMSPNKGSYKPSTYIPAGLIWGLNTLSSAAPFAEAKAYDQQNRNPRKALVLMTDGDNTMRYNNNASNGLDSKDGKHVAVTVNADGSWPEASLLQIAATNKDTLALCDTIKAKSRNIEIFTVALMVDNDEAQRVLQECASNAPGTLDHYYPAQDAKALAAAFSNIAQKLTSVRLVE